MISETTATTPSDVPELDLVFACDCTGSMGSYIKSAQDNIRKIIESVKASEKRDVRFALVTYKDYSDPYVSKVFPWTTKTQEAFGYVSQMEASGGGDTPEAVTEALRDINNLNYRKRAVRICVFVADAPPHGLCNSDDSYPNGAKDGLDPMQIVNEMITKEILIYSVGVEPVLGQSTWGRDFFKAIAEMTGGKYIALGKSHLLPQVIIGGAEEELEMEKLSVAMKEEETKIKAEQSDIKEEVLHKQIADNLAKKGVQCATLKVTDFGDGAPSEESKFIQNCKTLEEVRQYLSKRKPVAQTNAYSYSSDTKDRKVAGLEKKETSSPHSYEKQEAECLREDISYEKVNRAMNRKAKAVFK